MTVSAEPASARLLGGIARELASRRSQSPGSFISSIESEHGRDVLENLVFFCPPPDLRGRVATLLDDVSKRLPVVGTASSELYLDFLTDLALSLQSFLPRWNLTNVELHRSSTLPDAAVRHVADAVLDSLRAAEAASRGAAATVLGRRRAELEARLRAEEVADPSAEARRIAGEGLVAYVVAVASTVERSNFRALSEMRARGEIPTELGNDYAAFLDYTMYLGFSFVTSNPVLVDLAWVANPARWCPVMDSVVASHSDAGESDLARLATLEVVLANMRLLRPIFLLTAGKKGYVSLQVNPKKHGDAKTMIADATAIYAELTSRLVGGIPNVVFKLPATKAGLEACRNLTSRGMGVNITVNFAMFQQLPFAQAISEGSALAAYLTEMNGRLSFPIRDDLLAKLDELKRLGIDEREAREAAAWSGVAVTRRLHQLLTARGCDLTRMRPLVASLRWYTGDAYSGLSNPCPDVFDCAGVSVITVFPNIRRSLDSLEHAVWRRAAAGEPAPERHLEVLSHSELFRQAYFVADSGWLADDSRFKPEHEITLDDQEATADFVPVRDTLRQFGAAYDGFVRRLLGRRALVRVRQAAGFGRRLPTDEVRELLTGGFDVTACEGLRVIAGVDRDPAVAVVLKDEETGKAVEALGAEAVALLRHALAGHA